MGIPEMTEQEKLQLMKRLVGELTAAGRYDLLQQCIGSATLEQLNIEAAKSRLSPLLITKDYRFVLTLWNKEVQLSPIHKAVYILFLRHPEGIIFKELIDYREELLKIYAPMCNRVTKRVLIETINRLTDPQDNAINEKCSRIKTAFSECMDAYAMRHYIISGHTQRHIESSNRIWFERRKTITLPREFVKIEVQ